MQTDTIMYKDGAEEFEGFVAMEEGAGAGGKPCVVVCHAWAGQGAFEQEKAKMLAGLGYVGFALDVYGKGKRGRSVEENSRLMTPLMENRGLLIRRVRAGVSAAQGVNGVDRGKVGVIGFCFGGMCALDAARHCVEGVKGVVSFHGLFSAPPADVLRKGSRISAKVLVLHGFDDPMATPEQMVGLGRELTAAGADWQVHAYGNTMHAFTNPEARTEEQRKMGIGYEAKADRRSWAGMRDFFQEVFA